MNKINKDSYYRYENPNVGVRYFKVTKENEPVLQVIESVQAKKGRAYTIGITYITYLTFIGSWGWRLSESRFIKEISVDEFNLALNKSLNKLGVKSEPKISLNHMEVYRDFLKELRNECHPEYGTYCLGISEDNWIEYESSIQAEIDTLTMFIEGGTNE